MELPLVSCVMPTYGRPDYVAESLAMFLAQDYPNKELWILNDCAEQQLVGDYPGVHFLNIHGRFVALGEKRNYLIEQTRGEWIAVWDDDDIYMPWRLSYSLRKALESDLSFYVPAEFWAYWGDENLLDNYAVRGWISHPAFFYRRDLWRAAGGYPAQTQGEDEVLATNMLQQLGVPWAPLPIQREDRFLILRGKSKYVHTSIGGGEQPPDESKGVFYLTPRGIADPVLREVYSRIAVHGPRSNHGTITPSTERTWDIMKRVNTEVGTVYLDQYQPTFASVGFGVVGFGGDLGYEDKKVSVGGIPFQHALSTHAPARLEYELTGEAERFRCQVAINDDVAPGVSAADFFVFVDGCLQNVAAEVRSGEAPRSLDADLIGARRLELVVQPRRWHSCHSVWLEPRLVARGSEFATDEFGTWLTDPLRRADLLVPDVLPQAELCVATVGSPDYMDWIDDLFGSIRANGQIPDALLVIACVGTTQPFEPLAHKYQAHLVLCRPQREIYMGCKAVLYSITRVVKAKKFLCLDADMLVLSDLRPLVAAVDAAPANAVLVCRDAEWVPSLGAGLTYLYGGKRADLDTYFGGEQAREWDYPLVINDGLIAGTSAALRGAETVMRGFPRAAMWLDEPFAPAWRTQFVFNLALARGRCGSELDERYNLQVSRRDADFYQGTSGVGARRTDREVVVLHFCGGGRNRYSEWRGQYRKGQRPLSHRGGGQGYEEFVAVLRQWIGRFGLDAMAWTFYGTSDARHGQVSDPSTFPLLATLHYLLRANGCARVLETGTARGVSAACMASAIAHRDQARVVTMDPAAFPEREVLWAGLPTPMRQCIEPRLVDGLVGMESALANGETYHAALLDSIHTAEHVLAEFDLACRLVVPNGLILIHDPIYCYGTVGEALEVLAKKGYGIVRLWTATEGYREDDNLGLAVIENRLWN